QEELQSSTLGEIGSFKNGINKGKEDFGRGVPFVNLMDVFGKSVVEEIDLELVDASPKEVQLYSLKKGDVLFIRSSVKREGVGETALLIKDLPNTVYSGFLIRFRSNESLLFDSFKRYCFWDRRFRNRLISLSTTSANTNINQESLQSLGLIYPSLPEQRKIADFLSAVDEKIRLLTEKKEKLETYKKGVMQKLFPKQGQTNPELRFKRPDGTAFPDWEEKRWSDIGHFYYGKSAPKSSISLDAPTPCVRYGELYSTYDEIIEEIKSYTNTPVKDLKFSKGGEVLVPRVGEDPLDFANCSYLPFKGVAIGEMISVFNTKENGEYLTFYINGQLRRDLGRLVEGGSVANLYFRYLEDIRIKIPSREEQAAIVDFIKSVRSKIALIESKIDQMKGFKKGLLQQMFV
ncbi:MAG: restriction endonuclease subunit S, partial [Roseivirga sp.]|nr:restriction endonuclease subunit S [Roseivirga sp.]